MVLSNKSDSIGAFASGLCLVHCIITPLIFVIQPIAVQNESAPIWWKSLDYAFLFISFLAVYWSAKNTAKRWMSFALWISWIVLTFAIINEKIELLPLPELSVYIPAAALVVFHLYNRRYCKCAE